MNKNLVTLLAILGLVLLPAYAAGGLIGVQYNGIVVSIEETTGVGITIGSSGFSSLNSLAKDSAGTLYSASDNKLITINSTTGAGTQVATLDFGAKPSNVRGLAFSRANILYAVINDGNVLDPDYLYTVNVATGVATLVGATGLTGVQSITFSPSGVLYGWDVDVGLITINTATGVATDVNPAVGGTAEIQGIIFGADGILYGARDVLNKIDVATGVWTLVGSGGYSDVRGLETLGATSYTLIGPSWSNTNSPVYKINQTTGTGSTIGLTGFTVLNSLAKNNAGILYSASGNKLITINPTTGAGTQVATLDFGAKPSDVRGLAFSPGNVMYAVINDDGPSGIGPDYLYTVNVATGVATLVGATGLTGVQSITFAPSGVLYGWDVDVGLITINTTTGVATDVNPSVGGTAEIQGIVFAPDGTLYGARDALYKIDVATGVRTLVGAGGYSDVRGLEYVPFFKRPDITPILLLLGG